MSIFHSNTMMTHRVVLVAVLSCLSFQRAAVFGAAVTVVNIPEHHHQPPSTATVNVAAAAAGAPDRLNSNVGPARNYEDPLKGPCLAYEDVRNVHTTCSSVLSDGTTNGIRTFAYSY